jgi:hypothetical protein
MGPPLSSLLLNMKSEDVRQGTALKKNNRLESCYVLQRTVLVLCWGQCPFITIRELPKMSWLVYLMNPNSAVLPLLHLKDLSCFVLHLIFWNFSIFLPILSLSTFINSCPFYIPFSISPLHTVLFCCTSVCSCGRGLSLSLPALFTFLLYHRQSIPISL